MPNPSDLQPRAIHVGSCRGAMAAALLAVAFLGLGTLQGYTQATSYELVLHDHTGGPIRAVTAHEGSSWSGEGIGLTYRSRDDETGPKPHVTLGLDADVYSLARSDDRLLVGAADGVHVFRVLPDGIAVPVFYLPSPGTIRAISLWHLPSPPVVFLSDDEEGVIVARLEPERLRVVASIPGAGGSWSPVEVSALGIALIPGDNLHIVSVADPEHPVVLLAMETPAPVRGVAFSSRGQSLAYASLAGGEIATIDLSLPTAPEILGTTTGAPTGALHRLGDALLVVDDDVFVVEVDPTDPTALSVVGAYDGLAGTIDLAIDGDTLWAARRDLVTVAMIDPDQPRRQPAIVQDYHSTSPLRQLHLLDGHVYVTRGELGLDVVDVSDPQDIEAVVGYRPPWGAHGVASVPGTLFVSTDRGLECWDIEDPGSPVPGACEALEWEPTRWLAAGHGLLVSTSLDELHVAVLDEDDVPSDVGRIDYGDYPSWPLATVAQGTAIGTSSTAYVAGGPSGIMVIDVSDPAQPEFLHRVEATDSSSVRNVAVSGGYLATGTDRGVSLYDLHDPQQPELVGELVTGENVRGLSFSYPLIYVAAGVAGLAVVDASDPTNPAAIARRSVPYAITDAVGGSVAGSDDSDYVFAAGSGLLALQLKRRPTVPTEPPATGTRPPVVPTATPSPSPTATPRVSPTFTPQAHRSYLPLLWTWGEK